ncbi:MAG: undecaprenyldiphospho-muramoylpentapeptide beta-N-acetylglucosaminyltransferase [Pseudomonadales bacterium]
MKILFTGGGSAGHVTPSIALIEHLRSEGWDVAYIGSKAGIEKEIISRLEIPYFSIPTGKLRRYFSWQNFLDPFLVIAGMFKSLVICMRERPNVVFSKGGFVAVPVVVSAWICRIPVICHESDVTPGLANRLCFPFCRHICVNFPQTAEHLPGEKVIVSGTPVRDEVINGDPVAGRRALGLSDDKPVLLVFGGSLGARAINESVREALPALLEQFQIVHVVGNGNVAAELQKESNYHQCEYLYEGFGDVLAAADIVISRGGANAIYELLVARKPHILIPLSNASSRGDQIVNANTFAASGVSLVIVEEALSREKLLATLASVRENQDTLVRNMAAFEIRDSVKVITDLIEETANKGK